MTLDLPALLATPLLGQPAGLWLAFGAIVLTLLALDLGAPRRWAGL